MKKILILFVFHLIYFNNYCQDISIDTTSLSFKAKLFTVSEFGLSSKEQILKDIESQKITFLKSKYKKFIFMRIDFSQPYRFLNGSETTLIRECSYYVAYNISNSIFFKLGGFNSLDIDSFIRHLEGMEYVIPDVNENPEIEEIDIFCLYNYHEMSQKKRLRKGFSCLSNCAKKTSITISTH